MTYTVLNTGVRIGNGSKSLLLACPKVISKTGFLQKEGYLLLFDISCVLTSNVVGVLLANG